MAYATRSRSTNSKPNNEEKKAKKIKLDKKASKTKSYKKIVSKAKEKVQEEEEQNIYTYAKQVLTLNKQVKFQASELKGREEEAKKLELFWQSTVGNNKSGSLYISGQPGTGKTALVNAFVYEKQHQIKSNKVEILNINCVSSSNTNFFSLINSDLNIKSTKEPEENFLKFITNNKESQLVLILDEMDHLLSGKDANLLYKLFALVAHPNSTLVLIGIANDLALTERSLPRLRAKGYSPLLIPFQPYTIEQMEQILKHLLTPIEEMIKDKLILKKEYEGQTLKFMSTIAMDLLPRKQQTGDLRKLLDACKQAINLASYEALILSEDKIKGTINNLPFVMVDIQHVKKALNSTTASPMLTKVNSLNVNSQLILIAALNLSNFKDDLNTSTLYDEYVHLCEKEDLFSIVSRTEFIDLINGLDVQGFFIFKKSKSKAQVIHTSNTFSFCVVESELKSALKQQELVKSLLDE